MERLLALDVAGLRGVGGTVLATDMSGEAELADSGTSELDLATVVDGVVDAVDGCLHRPSAEPIGGSETPPGDDGSLPASLIDASVGGRAGSRHGLESSGADAGW
ncbi:MULTISPECIES: hypothetical protein [unclassified Agrococcus]|uniref:hypothetical protein n=1 Tax=unclassified Agrococcus TaxID=2615065 RepID=UPI00361C938D